MIVDKLATKTLNIDNMEYRHVLTPVRPDIDRYKSNTFPKITYQYLEKNGIHKAIYSAAVLDDQIIALAIFIRRPESVIQMISFYVKPKFRKQGVGSALMQDVLKMCRASHNQLLRLNYKTFWKSNTSWEKLLNKNGWQVKSTDNLYVRLENGQDLKQVHALMSFPIPNECQISHFDNQKLQQLIGWTKLINPEVIPKDVHPGKNLSTLNESCSLLLTIQDEIAGWIIGQQITEEQLQISSLFVFPKFRKHHDHLGLMLIAEAVKRNNHVGTTFFGMRRDNKFMHSFLKQISGNYRMFEKKNAVINLKS